LAAAALAGLAFPATALAGVYHHAVFTLSNSTTGNRVLVFARAGDGSLAPAGSVAAGGVGTGVNATTQGALALSPDGRRLYAVNGGSGTIAVFAVRGTHLRRLAVVPSGGAGPASVTAGRGRVYVVNAGGRSVVGFRRTGSGLARIAGGAVALASTDAGPAQVSLNPAGTALAVTNTASNTIDTITLRPDGAVRRLRSHPSVGATPFGFAFTRRGVMVVSDAHEAPTSAATSYRITSAGGLRLLSGPVSVHQLAACWVAVTPNGRIAFTANPGSGTLSALRVGRDGRLHLAGVAASPGAASKPLDVAVTLDGRFLDVLTDGLHSITSYRIGVHGSLSAVGAGEGLPVGDVGVASS
jgi:DNA-binding beta-propeller fold protein YncE